MGGGIGIPGSAHCFTVEMAKGKDAEHSKAVRHTRVASREDARKHNRGPAVRREGHRGLLHVGGRYSSDGEITSSL